LAARRVSALMGTKWKTGRFLSLRPLGTSLIRGRQARRKLFKPGTLSQRGRHLPSPLGRVPPPGGGRGAPRGLLFSSVPHLSVKPTSFLRKPPLPSALRAATFPRGEGTCPPLWGGCPRQGAGEVPRGGFCFRRCHICRWSRQASCGSHLFRQPFGLPPSPEGKAFALPFGEGAPARGRERCPEGASVFVGATFVGGADKLPAEATSSVSPSGCHRKRGYIATGNAVDFRFAALCSTPEGKAGCAPSFHQTHL